MRPTRFIILCLLLPWLVACQAAVIKGAAEQNSPNNPDAIAILESRIYRVQERFEIANHGPGTPSKHNLWVALIGDLPPYQEVQEMTISPQSYRIFTDEYDNRIAEFDLASLSPGERISITIDYRVKVNSLSYDLSNCRGDLPTFFTSPELYIESDNPQIRELSAQLSKGASSVCDQVRSFYDYIGDHLVYTYNGQSWGAQAALGEMGADCTEFASLMIALSRAAGIPARYLEGVLSLSDKTTSLARTEHAWLEVYLPGIGWTPMDPTLGRQPVLRNDYFARYTADHIIVSRGRNPSALRGASYFTHIYWPGNSTQIKIEDFGWRIQPAD